MHRVNEGTVSEFKPRVIPSVQPSVQQHDNNATDSFIEWLALTRRTPYDSYPDHCTQCSTGCVRNSSRAMPSPPTSNVRWVRKFFAKAAQLWTRSATSCCVSSILLQAPYQSGTLQQLQIVGQRCGIPGILELTKQLGVGQLATRVPTRKLDFYSIR